MCQDICPAKKCLNFLSGLMTCGSATTDLEVNGFLLLGSSGNTTLMYKHEMSTEDQLSWEVYLKCYANKTTSLAVCEAYFYMKSLSANS